MRRGNLSYTDLRACESVSACAREGAYARVRERCGERCARLSSVRLGRLVRLAGVLVQVKDSGGEVGDDVGSQGEVGGECKYEDEVNAYTAERVRVTGGASGRAKTRGLHLERIEGNARVLGDVVPGWCTSVCECSSVRV